jgi:hypothetical protein
MLVAVKPTVSFVYYDDDSDAHSVTPKDTLILPKDRAERFMEAGIVESVEPEQAPEDESEGDESPEAPSQDAAPADKSEGGPPEVKAPAKKAAAPKPRKRTAKKAAAKPE